MRDGVGQPGQVRERKAREGEFVGGEGETLREAQTQGSNGFHAANSRARLSNSRREQGPEAGRRAPRGAIRAARRKRQAGNGPVTSQGASGCGPRSARFGGEEPREREKLRRVNPRSGRFERSRLRKSVQNRQGRRTSKTESREGIPDEHIGVRKRCRGKKAQESRGNSQGSPQPIRVILWRRTQVHERRSRGNSRRPSSRKTSWWKDDQTTSTTKGDRPSDTAIRRKGLCRTGELHERRTKRWKRRKSARDGIGLAATRG